MTEQQEKNNRRIALVTSIGVHGLLLLFFMLIMAWRAPNPPLPEYGIELNFGLDQQGGGDIQPETSPGDQQSDEQTQQEEEQSPPVEKEVKEEAVKQEVVEQIVSKEESPVVVKEEKKETPKEVVKEKPVENKVKETPKEPVKKEEVKEVKPSETGKEVKKGDQTTSQGDDAGKVGDKGSPEGKLDANALYGKQGGGGGGNGFGLNMGGWTWAENPKIPNLPDNQDGMIEFEIECDENGDITRIETITRGLSPQAEQLLKDEIRRNSLVRTAGGKAPERSKGKVVFILKTK
jgi:outer membrane biosynthesis protein TonB